MKNYSDDAVTKADLTTTDVKQTKQITQLRIGLVVSFLVNLGLTLYLHLG